MSPSHRRPVWAVTLAAVTMLAATASAHAAGHTGDPLEGTRILLTNDDSMQNDRPDGSDGEGLYEVRKTLCQAGADVVVVAPWSYQSGAGTAVTNSGVMRMEQRTQLDQRYEDDCADAPSQGAVFGVCKSDTACTAESPGATPTDTVRLAVRGGLAHAVGWTANPDLVISGINAGPNIGSSVNDSGTAGAALAALSVATPGVAISTWTNEQNHLEAYAHTADFTARFVTELIAQDALRTDYAININYPDIDELDDGEPGGPVVVPVGTGTTARHTYSVTEELTFELRITDCEPADPTCVPETRENADHVVNEAGNITVTALTSDRTFMAATPELDAVVAALGEEAPVVEPSLSLSVAEVRAGEAFEATGSGLAGDEEHEARLVSADHAALLDAIRTTDEGSFTAELTVPLDTEPGAYEVRLFLAGSDVGVSAQLTVLASAEPPGPQPPEDPSTGPHDTTDDAAGGPVDASGERRDALPTTGADLALFGAAAIVLVSFGAVLRRNAGAGGPGRG